MPLFNNNKGTFPEPPLRAIHFDFVSVDYQRGVRYSFVRSIAIRRWSLVAIHPTYFLVQTLFSRWILSFFLSVRPFIPESMNPQKKDAESPWPIPAKHLDSFQSRAAEGFRTLVGSLSSSTLPWPTAGEDTMSDWQHQANISKTWILVMSSYRSRLVEFDQR